MKFRTIYYVQHERWDIQGSKTINLWPTAAQRDDTLNDITFEEGEVYTFEVWLTSDNHPEVCTQIVFATWLLTVPAPGGQ